MGLDQYGTARKGEPRTDENGYTYYEDSMELAYWRKHPNLQGYMENLWYAKGNEGEFNCVDLELTLGDIEHLEGSIMAGTLPATTGFFFGDNSDDHYTEEDLAFCQKAKEALAKGYTVIYYSWW